MSDPLAPLLGQYRYFCELLAVHRLTRIDAAYEAMLHQRIVEVEQHIFAFTKNLYTLVSAHSPATVVISPPLPWTTPDDAFIEDGGKRLGEIEAYRCWRPQRSQDGKLWLISVHRSTLWLPGKPMGGDVTNAGVFAWDNPKYARDYATSAVSGSTTAQNDMIAVGRVLLYGTVITHERGYRAQYARIVDIDDVFACQARYECPSSKTVSSKIVVASKIRDEIRKHYDLPYKPVQVTS